MSSIRHIWFDLDGTLTRYTPEFRRDHDELLYKTYALAVNKSLDDSLIHEFKIRYKTAGGVRAVFDSLGLPPNYWRTRYDTLESEKYFAPVKEVKDTLANLMDGLPVSLLTNSSRTNAIEILKIIDIPVEWFTFVITSSDIGAQETKPSTEGFRKIIELSKVPADSILYVGDRIKTDVLPAKQLGIKTCLVWCKSDIPTYYATSFKDILNITS